MAFCGMTVERHARRRERCVATATVVADRSESTSLLPPICDVVSVVGAKYLTPQALLPQGSFLLRHKAFPACGLSRTWSLAGVISGDERCALH